jgi:cytochrome c-type biogenesis protein CcmH/NrfG
MGRVLKKLGRAHDALAAFNHALDLDPKVRGAAALSCGGRRRAAAGGVCAALR